MKFAARRLPGPPTATTTPTWHLLANVQPNKALQAAAKTGPRLSAKVVRLTRPHVCTGKLSYLGPGS